MSEQLLPGLYEEPVTVALGQLIDSLDETTRAQRLELSTADAPSRLASHVRRVVSIVLEPLDDESRAEAGVALVHDLLSVLAQHAPGTVDDLRLNEPAALLAAIERRQPDGSFRGIGRPLTSPARAPSSRRPSSPSGPRFGCWQALHA